VGTRSDDFIRIADNATLGSNWTGWSWSGAGSARVASNKAAGAGINTTSGNFWAVGAFDNDQTSEVTVSTVPSSSDWVGATVRQTAPGTGYLGIWFNGNFYLFNENGTTTPPQLGAAVAGTLTAGDKIKVGVVGTTITLYKNGTSVMSRTDSTYTSGSAGLAFYGNTARISLWTGTGSRVTLDTTAIANVVQGVQVRRWLQASGGTAPYTFAVTVGTLPAGLSLASDGTLSGTPTGTGTSTFTVQVTDASSVTATQSLSITSVSAPFSPGTPSTDGNGVVTWNITSLINMNTAQTIRVLEPTAPSSSHPHALVIVLPVFSDNTYGNGLDTIRTLGLHNSLNLTAVEPSTGGNWLADNPSNANLLQETYLLQVVSWAKSTYGTTGAEKVYLLGFSRSGIAGQGLFLHHPDVYAKVATWDLPAMMTGYDGNDPNGAVAGGSSTSYGTQDNFTANYQLSATNLAKWASGQNVGVVNRIWLGGYNTFQNDVSQYDSALTTAGIAHTYASVSATPHNWSTTPQWVTPALTALVDSTLPPQPSRDRLVPLPRRKQSSTQPVRVTVQVTTQALPPQPQRRRFRFLPRGMARTRPSQLVPPQVVVVTTQALPPQPGRYRLRFLPRPRRGQATHLFRVYAFDPNDGVPVRNPGLTVTSPIPGLTLTVPDAGMTLTVPAARLELT
jgi:hypothetical protein